MGDKGDKITNEAIYELLQSIVKQNNKIQTDILSIKTEITSQNEEIGNLKVKVDALERQNSVLTTKSVALEKKLKENNLIVYNIPENEKIPLYQIAIDFFVNNLEVEVGTDDIDSVYRLGRRAKSQETGRNHRPILVKFCSQLKKRQIYSQARKLKGTNISISDDLTEDERKEKKVLYEHYRAAKSSDYPAKFFGNRVVINGKTYKYEDLVNSTPLKTAAKSSADRKQSQSAPASPNKKPEDLYFENTKNSEIPPEKTEVAAVNNRLRSNSKSSSSSVDKNQSQKGTRRR